MTSAASPSSLWHPDLLVGALSSKRLTLLYGVPGPQRDGMVRRGLMPRLRQHHPGGRRAVAIRFDGWGKLPLRALHERLAELHTASPDGPPPTLAEALRAIGAQRNTTVLLVLDGFERHLAEPAHRLDVEAFDRELTACVMDATVPVHVLMVIDEAAHGSLVRYRPWLTDAAGDVLRLPRGAPDVAAPWSDTDIDTSLASDDPASPGDDSDWTLDLVLDDPAVDAPSAAPASASPAATTAAPATTPSPAARAASADTPVRSAHPEAPPVGAPSVRSRAAAGTAAASTERIFAERPGAPPLPPWLSEADAAAWRRMDTAPSRWPALLGLAVMMAGLIAVAWMAALWILDSQRIEPAPRAPGQASTRMPAPSPPATETPVAAPAAPPAAQAAASTPPATASTARAGAPQTPQSAAPPVAAAVKTLTYALPLEADSAAPMLEALTRQVAAPAGLELRPAAPGESPLLTLQRTDALLAARSGGAAPLQVVAPLFSEQVQVVVRNDARWDYVREIRGLRLNIGRGARANTVRALYQQLFGTPLTAADTDERDVTQALQSLLQRGGPIDAMVVVSESPLLAQLPVNVRRQLRELTIDHVDLSKVTAMPAFSLTRRTPNERPRLSVTNFLVATGAPPRPQDEALRLLATTLCRAQPALQAQQSPLLRGVAPGEQPDVGWPYLLPKQGCPSEPATRASRPGGQS